MAPTRLPVRRVRWALAMVVTVTLWLGGSARAAAVRYEYGGTITSADSATGIAPGTRYSGTFTYDPDPSVPNLPVYKTLSPDPTAAGLTFSVGDKLVFSRRDGVGISVQQTDPFHQGATPTEGHTDLTVSNLDPSGDAPLIVKLNMANPNRAVFSALDKPLPLSLSDFVSSGLKVTDASNKTLYSGTLDTLKIVPIPFDGPDPSPVPEPASLLGWAGLAGALAAWAARKKR